MSTQGLPSTDRSAVCLGETMALVTPVDGSRLTQAHEFAVTFAGAESNVAAHLARAGITTQWVSRLGTDPLGDRILASLSAYGVGTDFVARVADQPTGVFFKDPSPRATEVFYYRKGSAASHLTYADLGPAVDAGTDLIHLTGITPSLSQECFDLTTTVLEAPRNSGQVVSFDVNFRAKMWDVATAKQPLLEFARKADVVLVGRDEAQELWGTPTPQDIRDLLPDVPYLVVKDADVGATEFHGSTATFVPAPRVEVLEPVGAGDAFAGGYLAALLAGYGPADRLQQGHIIAGQVLVVPGDLPEAHTSFAWLKRTENDS